VRYVHRTKTSAGGGIQIVEVLPGRGAPARHQAAGSRTILSRHS
jgi:hypothetical protein